jgi:hypothetical protein
MSIEEIRRHKADVLLECQEAEDRAANLYKQLRHLSGTLDHLARLLSLGEDALPSCVLNPDELQDETFKVALNYDTTVRLASDLFDAMKALHQAQAKKKELGLR